MGNLVWILFITPDGAVAGMQELPVSATAPFVTVARFVPAGVVGNGSSLAFVPTPCGWSVFYQTLTGALVEDWQVTNPPACRSLSPLTKDRGQTVIVPPGVGNPQSPIAALTRGDQVHLFFVRTDGAVATTWSEGRGWAAPFAITPPGAVRTDSPLAAVVRGGDQLHVFYIGLDGAVAATWAVGAWQKPFPITPPGAAGPGSRLATGLRRDQLHVFYQGPDGALTTSWAIGPWQKPFTITPPGAGRPSSSIAVVSGQ